jgi:MarR family transcriptional regulator, organic hydroperoxide resistance regulator
VSEGAAPDGGSAPRRLRDALAQVARASKSRSAEAMSSVGVYPGQNFLLDELWREDNVPLGELARRIGVEVPTLTRMSQRMESAGLLVRTSDPHDRRLVRIALTDRGWKLRDTLPARLDRVAATGLRGLSDSEAEQLISLLQRVARGMNEATDDEAVGASPNGEAPTA